MRQLDKHDLQWAVRLLPREVKEMMEEYGERIVLGGGFLRSSVSGERPNDIDLFTKSEEDAALFAHELAGKKKVLETGNAYSVRKVGGYFVQFIHRWTYGNPVQILESFDYTIACCAIWYSPLCSKECYISDGHHIVDDCVRCNKCLKSRSEGCGSWKSLVDDNFYSDLAAKRLVYRSPQRNEDAGGSILRMLKFYQRGFRIPLDSLGAVLARLVDGVDLKGIEVISAEGTSLGDTTEKRWAKVLTGLLREVDPLVDPTHTAHLPSMKETA